MRSEMPFMDEFGMVEAFATFPWMNTIATVAGDTPPAILFRMCFDLHHKHDSREANEYSKVVILLK